MCFSENHSYFNAILLSSAAVYTLPSYKLTFSGFFFAIKELLQGLLYRYQGNPEMLRFLSILSWIHISFQPLFFNLVFSYFSPGFKYWNIIFILSIIFGIILATHLNELDIQDDPDCEPRGKNDDFCSDTGAYIGNYHVAYTFKMDKDWQPISIWKFWQAIVFLPVLFTKARWLGVFSLFLVMLVYGIYNYSVGIKAFPGTSFKHSGEKAAIWCFLSVGLVPLILFKKNINKIL